MNESNRIRRRPRDQGGFTLIEIMVVIVILGLLATLVVPNVLGISEDAKVQKARTDVHNLADAVKMYKIRNNKTPTSIEDLTQADGKNKAYIETVPKDPWDHEYVIRDLERGDFEVLSLGPDGNEGTEDDISSKPSKDK
jgi:general secretion pathway protein G